MAQNERWKTGIPVEESTGGERWKTGVPVEPDQPRTRGAFETANDLVIEGANAAAGAVSSLANMVRPGNRVSSFIDENIIKSGEQKQSDVVKTAKQTMAQGIQEADGIGGELAAVGKYAIQNPLLAASQAAGSFAVPGAAAKVLGRVGGIGAGAALAGGDAAGTAYEMSSKAGATDEQALEAGRGASVIPALVGGVTGAFGAEKLLAGGKGFNGGLVSRALKTGGSEAGQEAFEEGVTQYEGQRAAMPYDATIDPTKGVAGAAGMGAIMGGATGAGVSLLTGNRDAAPIVKPSQAMGIDPAAGPLSRAAATAVDAGVSQSSTPQVQTAGVEGATVQQPTPGLSPEGQTLSPDPATQAQALDKSGLSNGESLVPSQDFMPAASAQQADPLTAESLAPAPEPLPIEARSLDELRQSLRNAQDPAIRKAVAAEIRRRREVMPDPLSQPQQEPTSVVTPIESVQASQEEQAQPAAAPAVLGQPLTATGTNMLGRGADPLQSLIQEENNVRRDADSLRNGSNGSSGAGPNLSDAGMANDVGVPDGTAGADAPVISEPVQSSAGEQPASGQAALSDSTKELSSTSFDSWKRQGMDRGTAKGWTIFYDHIEKTYRLARKVKEKNAAGGGYVSGEIVGRSFASVDEAKAWATGRVAEANVPDQTPQSGLSSTDTPQRPERWRQNALQAGKVARTLGLEPKGKRLAQIVAEIDAKDGAPQVDAPNNVTSLTDRIRTKVRDAAFEKAARQEIESQLEELSALGKQNRVTMDDLSRLQEITANNTDRYNASRDLHQLLKTIRTRAAGNIQTETPANVQDAPQAANDGQAQAAPVEASTPARGDAATVAGVSAAPGAGDVQADGVTEAWSLTREQYFNDPARVRREAVGPAVGGWKASYEYTEPSGAGPFKGSTVLKVKPKAGDTINAPFGRARITTVSAVKGAAIDNAELLEIGKAHHKRVVADALASGKPVPSDVLSEYPDLSKNQQKADTSAEPVQETAKTEQVAKAPAEPVNPTPQPKAEKPAEEQAGNDQTKTPAFQKWFGESKVVDESGKPMVMYHGTSNTEDGNAFTMFDAYGSNYGLFGQGAYFTNDPEVASSYTSKGKGKTPTVYSAFMSIKNPIDMDTKADPAAWEKGYPEVDFETWLEDGDTNESYYRAAEEHYRDAGYEKWEGAEAMQDGLRRMGFDGITHIGGGRVKSEGKKHRVFIAFLPEQIKSATGNNGDFNASKSDIRLSVADGGATESEAFKKWFGESKVVDVDGKPLVVFHGTPDARFINETGIFATMKERMLKWGKTPESERDAMDKRAFFFTSSERVAKTYADPKRAFDYQAAEEAVIPVYVSIKNPLEFDAKGLHWREAQKEISKDDFVVAAKKAGHDGVIIKNVRDSYDSRTTGRDPLSDVFVAFTSNQIKSSTKNRGTFDPANPDIRLDAATGDSTQTTYTPASDAQQKAVTAFADRLSKNRDSFVLMDAVKPSGARAKEAQSVSDLAKTMFGREAVFVKFKGRPLFNGAVSTTDPGKIFVNIESARPMMAVLGHELLHELRKSNPAAYNQLAKTLKNVTKDDYIYEALLKKKYRDQGLNWTPQDISEELYGDIVGDNFMDPKFWEAIAGDKPIFAKQLYRAVMNWLDKIASMFKRVKVRPDGSMVLTLAEQADGSRPFGTQKYLQDIEAARAAVAQAMGQFKQGGKGRDSLSVSGTSKTMTEDQAIAKGFTMKAYRGVSKANPFNDTGTTWLTTSREVAEVYAEEVMGYDDPGVIEVMVNPSDLKRHDASRLTDEQREQMQADDFGNPQAVGIYDRSDDHPLGGSRRNVTVIHAPMSAVAMIGSDADIANFSLADAVEQIKQFDVKTAPKNTWAHYRGMAMQALGRRQIVDLYAEELPQLEHYNDLVQRMDAEKNETGAEADKLAQDWSKLKDGEDRKLAELMHDATLSQVDPSKAMPAGFSKKDYDALKGRYDAMTPEAKRLFGEARDMYADHFRAVQQAIKERIERSEMSDGQKRQIMAKMDEELFKELKGVYFPLARFGQYVIVVKDANGEVKNVTRAETVSEAEQARKELQKAFPAHMGNTVGKVLKQAEFNAGRDAVGKGFMADLMGALDAKGVDDELRDTVAQLYLSSLPDLSWAKHGIHRKGTPGFSQDARRAFAQNMFHGARYLAKLRYADQLQDELIAMQDHVKDYEGVDEYDSVEAQQVVDEMVKRHEILMNPKSSPVSTALTSFGFLFHMGLSPASAMVNLTQTALVAFPQMGAKWGFTKSSAALLKASEEVVRAKNDLATVLKGDELDALNRAIKDGTIDVTMAHDLAGIAQGEDQGVMWKIRPVMRWASFMFHHAEKFNRQATFIAAYRLAKEAAPGRNFDQLYEDAKKVTYDGHYDYSASNRPRVMQGNWQRVILLFKSFAQNTIYTLARNAHQSVMALDPKERTQARKALGGLLATHAAAAGVLGLPIVGPLLTIASWIGGDDDEPWDAEVAMQNAMAELMGPKAAEVMARGLSRLTPWDLSGRVALNKLILPDVQEGLQGKEWAESAMAAALGPVAGIGINVARGVQKITEGDYMRGMEDMLPTALRGPIKALRYADEGAVDKTGIVITDEVSAAGVLGQASGFSPSQVRRDTERRSAIYGYDKALLERRTVLMRMFAEARIQGDAETAQEVQADIQKFNEKHPNRRITGMNLAQSIRNRRKRVAEAEQGVYLPSKRRDAIDAVNF